MEQIVQYLVSLLGIYLAFGLIFACLFAWRGAPRIDSGARGSSLTFRLLLVPGATALWPLLLFKWIKSVKP